MNGKQITSAIALIFFIVSIVLMIVAEHASDSAFLVGLGLFIIFIIILLISLFWKVAGTADDFVSRHW